jgi:PTH2 family peptidyl-tRNA hydrolase
LQMEPSQTINTQVGRNFQVELKANPSTGYSWVQHGTHPEILALGRTYVAPPGKNVEPRNLVVGAGGVDIMEFQALSEGEHFIEFRYRRPWEDESAQSYPYHVKVNVIDPIKQVIVMRRHYPDGKGGNRKIRTGKMCAQAAHASMAFLTNKLRDRDTDELDFRPAVAFSEEIRSATFTEEEIYWIEYRFAKVVVYVDSEEELLAVQQASKDAGDTEFGGEPTYTALGIGPHKSSKLQPITGKLPLL